MKKLILKSLITFLIFNFAISISNAQTISTGNPVPGSPYCAGTSIIVPFNSSGLTFSGGNVFVVKLSDGTGSFASPTNIGNLTSVAVADTINCVIPLGTPTGTNYAIRVVSTAPAVTGSTYTLGNIFALPIVSATVVPNDTVCFGTAVTLSGTGASTYSWSGGITDGVPFVALNSSPYAVTGTDINGCTKTALELIYVRPNTGIYGSLSYSGGAVDSGKAVIHPYQAFFAFNSMFMNPINPSGYQFTNVPPGDYIIKVFPHKLGYPTLAPTYFGNHWIWDSAVIITHGCLVDDIADVIMVEKTGTGLGIGLLHGTIFEGNGFGRAQGDPVHGVDVKLGITGSSTIVASTETDTITGEYTFSDVSYGNYTVYADIPGLDRVTIYTLNVDTANNQYLCLDHVVDSVAIDTLPCSSVGINTISSEQNKFNVYPNPFRESTTIAYSISSDAYVKLNVYNVVGVKVQSLVNSEQESGEFQYNFNPQNFNLKAGMYFISLSVNGKTNTRRIVVLE